MEFYHKGCGGTIDPVHRRCLKCKKQWNLLSFQVNNEIRMVPGTLVKTPVNSGELPWWMDKTKFVDKLPKWPRWLRIVTVVLVLSIPISIIIWIGRL